MLTVGCDYSLNKKQAISVTPCAFCPQFPPLPNCGQPQTWLLLVEIPLSCWGLYRNGNVWYVLSCDQPLLLLRVFCDLLTVYLLLDIIPFERISPTLFFNWYDMWAVYSFWLVLRPLVLNSCARLFVDLGFHFPWANTWRRDYLVNERLTWWEKGISWKWLNYVILPSATYEFSSCSTSLPIFAIIVELFQRTLFKPALICPSVCFMQFCIS